MYNIGGYFIGLGAGASRFGGITLIPFPEGAIAYYRMDESSGAVIDAVSGNNGTNNGATPNVTGKINTAYEFDGLVDSISMGDLDVFSFNDGSGDLPFTISAWVKPNLGVDVPIVSKYEAFTPTFKGEYSFYMLSTGNVMFQVLDGATTTRCLAYSTETLTDAVWSHVVATYDASAVDEGIKIYINGT